MDGFELLWMSDLVLIGTKGLVLLAVTALATLLLRKASAAARHAVWFLGMAGLLLLPFAAWVAPTWVVEVPAESLGFTSRAADASVSPARFAPAEIDRDAADVAAESGVVPEPALRNLSAFFLWLWLGGSAVLVSIVIAGLVALARRTRRSPLFLDERIDALTRELALAQGMRGRVPVLRGRADAMPMSWGLVRRVILLPAGAERWGDPLLESVLGHELAHVRRRDCLTQAIAELSLALNWLNPLAWLAVRRLRVEREHACDDAVVLEGVRPSDYARALIDLAESANGLARRSRVAAAMIRPIHLNDRLRAILDEGRPRRLSWPGAAAAAFVAVPLVGAVAALTPAAGRTDRVQANAPSEVIRPEVIRPEVIRSVDPSADVLLTPHLAVPPATAPEGAAARPEPNGDSGTHPDRATAALPVELAPRQPARFVDLVPPPASLLRTGIDPDRIEPIERISRPLWVQDRGSQEELGPPVTIHVKNQNFQDARLWLINRRGRVPLGAVTGKADASFTTPVASPADVWSVEIDLIGGEWCETEPLPVDPGDVLDLLVVVDVSKMPGCYPAGVKPEV